MSPKFYNKEKFLQISYKKKLINLKNTQKNILQKFFQKNILAVNKMKVITS